MSSDWLFILVFYPSVVALATIIVACITQKERENIYKAAFLRGYEYGEKELARKIYENVCSESEEEDEKNDE